MKKIIIIGGIVVLLGTGLFFFYKDQIAKLENMQFDVVGISVDKLSLEETILNLKIKLTSTSTINAEVSNMDLDIYVGAKGQTVQVGKANDNGAFVVPSKGYSFIDVKVTLLPQQTALNIVNLTGGISYDKNATLILKGTMSVKSAFIKTNIPFSYESKISDII